MKKFFSLILFCNISLFSQQNNLNIYFFDENSLISLNEFQNLVLKNKILYIGETHNNKEAHLLQLEVIKLLNKKNSNKVAVGFEMLNFTLQPILDEYMENKIDEKTFLEKIDWQKEWGFDFNLYKPIFDYIKENKLKALALNAPKKIISKIAKGGLKNLTDEERAILPKEIKINNETKYMKYLTDVYNGQGQMTHMISFENYLLSMATWNETMAEKAVEFLKDNKDYSFAFIVGNGHTMYNSAIPWSFKERINIKEQLSIYTENILEKENFLKNPDNLADIIYFLP